MWRDEADVSAFNQYAKRKLLRFVLGIPLTWALVFLLWTLPLLFLATGGSYQRQPYAVDLVLYPGLFLANVLTPILSLELLAEALHDIVIYYNLQVHLKRVDSERADSTSLRQG